MIYDFIAREREKGSGRFNLIFVDLSFPPRLREFPGICRSAIFRGNSSKGRKCGDRIYIYIYKWLALNDIHRFLTVSR